MAPYYLQMRLPGQAKEGFLILQPFVPVATGDQELTNLSSFMVAKSDPAEYGRLEAYTMPVGSVVPGPDQINAIINSTPEFSRQRTLLDARGSELVQGSLLLVPVEQSLLYVRPLYIEGTGDTKLPEFKFLVAVYGNKAVIGDSLPAALAQLFPDLGQPPPTIDNGPVTTPSGPATGDVAGLLQQAETAYNDAQAALKNGDLSAYQKAVDKMADLIRQSRQVAAPTTSTTTAPGATTTTTRK
jgi:uncharacterized membrane protein (UPF0182 family)